MTRTQWKLLYSAAREASARGMPIEVYFDSPNYPIVRFTGGIPDVCMPGHIESKMPLLPAFLGSPIQCAIDVSRFFIHSR